VKTVAMSITLPYTVSKRPNPGNDVLGFPNKKVRLSQQSFLRILSTLLTWSQILPLV